MSELATVIESYMDVVRVNKYIGFDYNMPWGGGTEIIKVFSRVEIVTKYNKVVVGLITGFEESNVEGKQDYITVKTEKGIVEVGIYDIESLECEEDALVV